MSILDELKQKVEAKKQAQYEQSQLNEQLEHTYQQTLLPKLQFFYDCLHELVEYLNFLEEPVQVHHYSRRYPQFGTLSQKNYKINTDGIMGLADYNRLMQVNVSFNCEAEGGFSYALSSKPLADKEYKFLFDRGLRFQQKHQHPDKAVFVVERKIPVRFQLRVDYPSSMLKVSIYNHESFRIFRKRFTPEQLDDEFLDAFLCYFMRRDDRFVRADISEGEKSALLNHIAPFVAEAKSRAGAAQKSGNKIGETLKNIFAKLNTKL
jgi:hypothetical protein